jgi:septal ring factor EnvC (AmiA/AmiB activator)
MSGAFKRLTLLALIVAGTAGPPGSGAQAPTERELARIRDEIAELERSLTGQIERRDDGMAELRRIELALGGTRTELADIAASIETQSERVAAIAAEMRAADARLANEQAALGEQARMSYMTGRQEFLRLLLSQENPADFGRMLVYYDYLNRYRSEQIAAVETELTQLAALREENAAVTRELESLEAGQQDRLDRLEREQAQRRALVAELDSAIESEADRIERMRVEEAELNETIARLAEIAAAQAINAGAPFAEQRGNLDWPVEGRIAARFGSNRDADGVVRWDGILVEAPAGTPVRAVHDGEIRLAQWQTFMGMFVIIDHGDGYLSLYGHNGALLRERGDRVRAGDVIAEVGNTGGRGESALFFGIRENLVPVDPADWLR